MEVNFSEHAEHSDAFAPWLFQISEASPKGVDVTVSIRGAGAPFGGEDVIDITLPMHGMPYIFDAGTLTSLVFNTRRIDTSGAGEAKLLLNSTATLNVEFTDRETKQTKKFDFELVRSALQIESPYTLNEALQFRTWRRHFHLYGKGFNMEAPIRFSNAEYGTEQAEIHYTDYSGGEDNDELRYAILKLGDPIHLVSPTPDQIRKGRPEPILFYFRNPSDIENPPVEQFKDAKFINSTECLPENPFFIRWINPFGGLDFYMAEPDALIKQGTTDVKDFDSFGTERPETYRASSETKTIRTAGFVYKDWRDVKVLQGLISSPRIEYLEPSSMAWLPVLLNDPEPLYMPSITQGEVSIEFVMPKQNNLF